MSSTNGGEWRYPETTDNDYWELQYLKTLKPEWFKTCALICAGVGLLLMTALIAIVDTIGWPHWSVIVLVVVNVVAAFVVSIASVFQLAQLRTAIDHDDREGRLARRPIAEALRLFALKQEHDFGFLLTIKPWHPNKPHDDREDWALDHAREIRKDWPADFEEYRKLQANVNYNRARSDIFERIDHGYGKNTLLFEQILESRQDMRDRVGRSLRIDRATTAIERDGTIEETEKLREERMRDVATKLRRSRPEDETWS